MTVPSMGFKAFSFDSDGKHVDALFCSWRERAVVIRWNIETGVEVKSLQIATNENECAVVSTYEIWSAVFSKNNTVLITGHWSKICVWTLDGDSSTLSTTIKGDWLSTTAIDVTRSGDVIASGGDDGVIRLFDASSGAPLAVCHRHTSHIKSLVFSPQEDRLVSTSIDLTVRVWDTRKEAWSLSSPGNSRRFDSIVFSPNGKFIAARSRKDSLVWDGTNGSILFTLTGRTYIESLTFSPDSALLASFSRWEGVYLWSVGLEESVPRTLSNSNIVGELRSFRIVFSATGNQLAVVNEMGGPLTRSFQVRIWNVSNSNGDDLAKLTNEPFQSKCHDGDCPHFLQFSSKESLVLVRHPYPTDGDKVTIWDRMADAVEEHDYDEDSHSSPKPSFKVVWSWIVSVRTGRRLFWLPESRRPGPGNLFATHKSLIATASSDGFLSLLDMSPFEGL
jgi:WD40 repeat protein